MLAAKAVREQLADALLGIEAAREAAGGAEDGSGDSALVIDGIALAHALGSDMRQTLLAVRAAWPEHDLNGTFAGIWACSTMFIRCSCC